MCVIEDSPRLETRRLLLRAPEARDVSRIAELAADWDVVRMTGRMPHPYTLADAETFVATAAAQDPRRDNTFLYICGLKGLETGIEALLDAPPPNGDERPLSYAALKASGRLFVEVY